MLLGIEYGCFLVATCLQCAVSMSMSMSMSMSTNIPYEYFVPRGSLAQLALPLMTSLVSNAQSDEAK